MVKRCIYFIKDNRLYMKSVDVLWDNDAIEVSKVLCHKEIEKNILPFMEPCVDVSSASGTYRAKGLATCFVKDDTGKSLKDIWKMLEEHPDFKFMPPGSLDLLYIKSLTEEQVEYTLCQGAFYDIFHNPDKALTCNAKALAVLQLLYRQGKVDYVEDMHKFLWWYYVNCRYAVEWLNKDNS